MLASVDPLITVDSLVTVFQTERGPLRAVDRVSFSIQTKEVVAIVGESGCGKSVTALSILRLLPHGAAKTIQGRITFKQRNLLELSMTDIRKIRGKEISMIFQDPMTALNPVIRVGRQIAEPLEIHNNLTYQHARPKVLEVLEKVGINDAEQRIDDYPHQFSGGQRQRLMIAMALINNPNLLIADEPTTALDVTVQMQILELMRDMMKDRNMSILLITHDLGTVDHFADRVLVMYAGALVESADTETLFSHPRHPYTIGLMQSVSRFSIDETDRQKSLYTIGGQVPDLKFLPSGCRFSDRCAWVKPHCRRFDPPTVEVKPGHQVACWEWEKINAHS